MKSVKVPINKSKAIRLFVFFVLGVMLSSLFVLKPQFFVKGNYYGFVKVVGYIGTVIFVLAATVVSNKVFNRKPGLQIDSEGLTDGSMGVLFSKVLWKDIAGFKKLHAAGENFIAVMVKHPQNIISSEPNPVKRKMLKLNFQTLNTPVNIAASRLKMDFDQLYALVQEAFDKKGLAVSE